LEIGANWWVDDCDFDIQSRSGEDMRGSFILEFAGDAKDIERELEFEHEGGDCVAVRRR